MSLPKTVFLHAGQGKTGSSYIQSSLSNSIDILSKNGIEYPIDRKIAARARNGHITSGNVKSQKEDLEDFLKSRYLKEQPSVLLSNEAFYDRMFAQGLIDIIKKHLPEYQIRLIVFIRDPLDHAVSGYHQSIKRGNNTKSFDDFLNNYSRLKKDRQTLPALQSLGIDVTIKNYTRNRSDLLSIMEEFLRLPSDSLVRPERKTINRSMTRAELELQKAFNKHYGQQSSAFISDRLCNSLPEIKSQVPEVSRKAMGRFLKQANEDTEFLARFIPESERHHIPNLDEAMEQFPQEIEPERFCFTSEQLDVLAFAISEFIKARSASPTER